MIYFSEAQLDNLLLEDISQGDLTTRSLGIQQAAGRMNFYLRSASRTSGIRIAARLLEKLDLKVEEKAADGHDLSEKTLLLSVTGPAGRLHQGWKVAQNVLEWSCGVADSLARLVELARTANPKVRVACTRKSIPGTKLLAQEAVLNGGGILHRGGTAETILLFANHRNFYSDPKDWEAQIATLRSEAPEKKIVTEADTMEEALAMLTAGTDVLQLDKFTPDSIKSIVQYAQETAPHCLIAAAGGINATNIADYAATGATLLVTSAPYYAKPKEVAVRMEPIH